jgi:pentatricopeptide repeat protein
MGHWSVPGGASCLTAAQGDTAEVIRWFEQMLASRLKPNEVPLGPGRIFAFHCRSSASNQIHS